MGSAALFAAVIAAGLVAVAPAMAAAGSGAVPAKSYGPSFSLPDPGGDAAQPTREAGATDYDLSLGCIVGGTTGTALSVAAGGMNVVNLIAGGLVPAASPIAAWVALGGVVFASFCSVGQALTPAIMASYSYWVPPSPGFGGPTMDARYCQIGGSPAAAAPSMSAPLLPARYGRSAAERM